MSQSLQLVYWRCLIYFCVLFCDFQQSRQGGHRAKVWFQLIVVVLLGQAEVCFWHGLFSLQQGKNCPHHYSRARVLIFTHNAVLLILMSIVLFISFHNLCLKVPYYPFLLLIWCFQALTINLLTTSHTGERGSSVRIILAIANFQLNINDSLSSLQMFCQVPGDDTQNDGQ